MKYTRASLLKGITIEKAEHADLAREVRKAIATGTQMSAREIGFLIADAHLREDPHYYDTPKRVAKKIMNAPTFRFRIGG